MHPLFDKYLFAWKVWNDYNKYLYEQHLIDEDRIFSDISRFFIEIKYSLKECVHFSIECSVIGTLLYSAIVFVTKSFELNWEPPGIGVASYVMDHGPLTTELFLLFVFGVMILIGQSVHWLYNLLSKSGEQDQHAVSRYLTLYPGMILCSYFIAIFVDASINSIFWLFESVFSITLYEWISVVLGFIVIFSYLAVVYFVLFAPIIFIQLIKYNYGSKAKMYTALVLAALSGYFVIPYLF